MSINGSMDTDSYVIQLEVPEELIESIISNGKKPKKILSNFLKRVNSEIDIKEIINYSEGKSNKVKIKNSSNKRDNKHTYVSPVNKKWSYDLFDEYMQRLVKKASRKADVADLISMLIAYSETSSRPTSEDLREARGFGPGDKWFEELRTTKSRLTIFAKHLGLPSFFLRAYGSGMNRKHPIDEKVYAFLTKWFSKNNGVLEEYKKVATPRSTK